MKRPSFLNRLCCFSWYKTRGLAAAAVWKLQVNWIPLLANGAPWNYIGCTLFRDPTDLDLCSFQSVSTDPEENKVRVRLVGLSTEGSFKGLYPEAHTHTKKTQWHNVRWVFSCFLLDLMWTCLVTWQHQIPCVPQGYGCKWNCCLTHGKYILEIPISLPSFWMCYTTSEYSTL